MSTTQNLKFIHLNSGSASTYKDTAGAIIFEKASGRIAVATGADTDVEYYGGGRIADAKFENSKLTLLFNDGSDAIELDFSDTASASGVNAILKGLRTDVDALKDTVGNAESGLVKDVADNKVSIQANANAISAINHETTGILATAKGYTDSKLTELRGSYSGTLEALDSDITTLEGLHAGEVGSKKTVAAEIIDKVGAIDGTVKGYVDGLIGDANGDVTDLSARVTNLETTVNGNGSDVTGLVDKVADNTSKLTTLIGSDASKSVRTIANEELAAQLIPEGAKESLNTLQEIAAWIQAHPDDAAAMNNKIAALETTVGDSNKGLVKDVAANTAAISANTKNIGANAAAIKALQDLHASGKTVAQEVSDGITGIAEASKSAGTDVKVTVKTKSGSVSEVAVDASVLDGKVTAEVTRATQAESALRTDLGTKAEGESDAFTRIKALEDKQSSGSLMWSIWE